MSPFRPTQPKIAMSQAPTNRRESTDDRRHAIAMAARDLITEKGFEGLRTRDIADRVGINIATLHYHVPTKDALVTLVAETMREEFQVQSARRPRAGLPPLVQFRMEIEDFRETVSEMPQLMALMVELGQRARRDPTVAKVMRPLHEYWQNQFIEIFRSGVSDGTFRADLDPVSAGAIVTGTLADIWRQTSIDLDQLDKIARELERAFLKSSEASKD